MDNYDYLRTHPLFKNLSEENRRKLAGKFREYSCDEGAVIYYQNDGTGSLYLFLEGEFCSATAENREKCYYLKGDYTPPAELFAPDSHKNTLICRSPGRYLKLDRRDFLSFVSSLRRPGKELTTVFDNNNRLISGFNIDMSSIYGEEPEKMSKYQWRKSGFFLFEKIFYPFVILFFLILFSSGSFSFPYDIYIYRILSAGLILYSLTRFVLWLSEKYILTEKNISALKISFRPLGLKKNLLPLDQIRGIAIEKKKLKNRFFNIGSILIQTSSGTVLKLSNIDKPLVVQKVINDFINHSRKQDDNKERIEIRKKMEEYFHSREEIHCPDEGETAEEKIGETVFKKSFFYLISVIWWQIAVIVSLAALVWLFRDSGGLLLILPAPPFLFVMLWRVQDWRNDLYKVSSGKIIDINKKPFGKSESNNLADIGFVTNIRCEKKGILQYLFNFGDVLIETAGGSISFETVTSPLSVQAELLRLREEWKELEEQKKRERQFQDFLVYSEIYKQAEEQNRISRLTPPLAEDPICGVNTE